MREFIGTKNEKNTQNFRIDIQSYNISISKGEGKALGHKVDIERRSGEENSTKIATMGKKWLRWILNYERSLRLRKSADGGRDLRLYNRARP